MADEDEVRRELEGKLLTLLDEYHRGLRRAVVSARGEAWGRYRYAEGARKDLEDASAQAAQLRERLASLSEEAEDARQRGDELGEADLKIEHASTAEELARLEGLVRAAEALLSRPEFGPESYEDCVETVSDAARAASEKSGRLRQALEEAFERGEREVREAAEIPDRNP